MWRMRRKDAVGADVVGYDVGAELGAAVGEVEGRDDGAELGAAVVGAAVVGTGLGAPDGRGVAVGAGDGVRSILPSSMQ